MPKPARDKIKPRKFVCYWDLADYIAAENGNQGMDKMWSIQRMSTLKKPNNKEESSSVRFK